MTDKVSRRPERISTTATPQENGLDQRPTLKAIDLFCGAGGLTQGFRQAGFEVRLGLDLNEDAAATFQLNHGVPALATDVTSVSGADLLVEAGINQVDVLIGGPSCQGFSTHGRRNGWVREDDPRNYLYKQYARLLDDLKPAVFVMENVPGLMYFDDGAFGRGILGMFEQLGYRMYHRLMLAADYGVPQLRKRLIIVGTRVDAPFHFPSQTHMGAYRRDAIELWNRRRRERYPHLAQHLTVWDAISDLPPVPAGGGEETQAYGTEAQTPYQALMRTGSPALDDHQAVPLPTVHLDLIKHVREGQTWREIPPELLPSDSRRSGEPTPTNLFARLDRTRPAYTITTQAYNVTTGCYTHPIQDRALTAREAARIQWFPDLFRFTGGLSRSSSRSATPSRQYLLNRRSIRRPAHSWPARGP